MGVAKAALEASMRYLATDLGQQGIRVNALSPGPVRTLAGAGITDARATYAFQTKHSPLRRPVTLDEIVLSDGKPNIHVSLWVERDSQKGIVIGKAGSMLKKIGSEARAQIQTLLGYPVHLSIQVRVAPDWQRNPKQLGKLGF
jgi:hypothetical protein